MDSSPGFSTRYSLAERITVFLSVEDALSTTYPVTAVDSSSHSLSDFMPEESSFLEGEYEIDGLHSIDCAEAQTLGDLHRSRFLLSSDFGEAEATIMGKEDYLTEWTAYRLRGGMAMSASMQQSYVALYFQLEGAMQSEERVQSFHTPLRAGDNNLSFVPAFEDTAFDLDERNEGNTFSVVLSTPYFADLAARSPALLGTYYDKMLRDEAFSLRDEHLRITPEMWGIIHRIRRRDLSHAAGSLFLEAQILELLALQLQQLEQPIPSNGVALSSADTDRMHAARDVLLNDVAAPPTLAELARRVGTNEYTLKRGFKAVFGNSPYAYLIEHKLELARAYLLDTDRTVAEVAYHVGYSDPAHLTHAFRKQYGICPSDLRRIRKS